MKTVAIVGGIAVLALAFAAYLSQQPEFRAEKVAQAQAEMDRIIAEERAASDAEILRLNIQTYSLDYGDAAADFYVHCTHEPPTQPANRAKCQTAQDRMAKMIAAYKAKAEKERANW